jgi:hypothetical protein
VRENLAQNLLARSKPLLHAIGEHKELITAKDCRWPMRDQHNDRSTGLKANDCLLQGRLALAV